MKKHLLLTAALIAATFSMNSFAHTQTSTTSLQTELAATAAQAYAQGHELLSELNDASAFELSQTLETGVQGRVDTHSYAIEDGSVELVELSRTPGVIEYQAVVDVTYSFDAKS